MGVRSRLRLAALKAAGNTLGPGPRGRSESRRIALIRPDHLGDLVLATPAIERICRALPGSTIDLWVGPWSAELARGIPQTRESPALTIRVAKFPGLQRAGKGLPWSPYLDALRLATRMRTERYDVAVLLRYDHWWGALVARLAGIPHRVGYDVAEVAPFLTDPLPYRARRHEALQNSDLIDAAIRISGGAVPEGPPSRPRIEFDLDYRSEHPNGPYAVFHPGAGALVKRWRPDGFASVAAHLTERYGLSIVVTGAAAESGLVDSVLVRLPSPGSRFVGYSIAELAGVLKNAAVVIGPDSGALHLASAVGAPSVRLFGPVDWRSFGPWADPGAIVVASTMACSPCNRLDYRQSELAAHPCIREIETDRVIAAVDKLLSKVPA